MLSIFTGSKSMGAETSGPMEGNMNDFLRQDLISLINRATSDQLYIALQSPKSRIRNQFIRFLAVSFANWTASQPNTLETEVKRDWKQSLKLQKSGIKVQSLDQIPSTTTLANRLSDDDAVGTSEDEETDINECGTMRGPHSNGHPKTPPLLKRDTPTPGALYKNLSAPNQKNYSFDFALSSQSNASSSSSPSSFGAHSASLNLREKNPFAGFRRLYTDSAVQIDHVAAIQMNALTASSSTSSTHSVGTHSVDNVSGATFTFVDSGDLEDIADEMEQQYFDALSSDQQRVVQDETPTLSELDGAEESEGALMQKLALCETKFDFASTNPFQRKGIEVKRQILRDILDYIGRYPWYSNQIMEQCIKTIEVNLFRALPELRIVHPDVDEEPFEDPQWIHLSFVYELAFRLITSTDFDKKTLRERLQGGFLHKMLRLFASEDKREREYLKTVLHRVYGRFMPLRKPIRTAMAHRCLEAIYSNSPFESTVNGIAEFLEIFCSIIHGFSVPVKQEHKDYLRNVLVPLHKCTQLKQFHEQMTGCALQFVMKDPSVAPLILGGLLKFWPIQMPKKELLFITEAMIVLNALINHQNGFVWPRNRNICIAVIEQFIKCTKSAHQAVAERALQLWEDDSLSILISLDKEMIWPKIVKALLWNQDHWNEDTRQVNEETIEAFRAKDAEMFNSLWEQFNNDKYKKQQRKEERQRRKERRRNWSTICEIVSKQKGTPPPKLGLTLKLTQEELELERRASEAEAQTPTASAWSPDKSIFGNLSFGGAFHNVFLSDEEINVGGGPEDILLNSPHSFGGGHHHFPGIIPL